MRAPFDTISILAVLADRDSFDWEEYPGYEISILAVLADRDGPQGPGHRQGQGISILAVLADRDIAWAMVRAIRRDFNPRGPCGPRHGKILELKDAKDFNPRGPCGPRLSI